MLHCQASLVQKKLFQIVENKYHANKNSVL